VQGTGLLERLPASSIREEAFGDWDHGTMEVKRGVARVVTKDAGGRIEAGGTPAALSGSRDGCPTSI
jgi:hypothetical protein